ncbi:hypothetical protein U879_06555 [Defluviimonas sp. 20V17]|uniref:Uncharacterized protein n=1 Tax=Allgaiera indica TaxID=765699 RepID=A0AAN4UUZ9_9RHOB|nr:hypothetical protein [Allgaiera indica]KDB04478.1 hypothetical protein U879_06555 [Defluviimonas sp. 20V17]GHE06148.1 hypothetical protein GCM10008024_39610 [Allgaiera indica]SDX86645.1 hypothetical protein SAMN05444006_13521 [Allgaiera indica]
MPELIRMYIRNVLIGWALAAVFVALLIGFNIAGLGHLVLETRGGWLAAGMLWVANAAVFAGVQFAIAVMRMAEDDGPRGGTRLRLPPGTPIPVRAEATAPRKAAFRRR